MPGSSGPNSPARVAVTMSPYRDRRASTSSDTSDTSTTSRQLSIDSLEVIPTRQSTVTASKPAANPLQFVKVGPCNLYRSAQETLKKVDEVKKIKEEVRNQEEDWQSNLDNWKSSRRKRQEHIIERVVEVKKLEMEEFDRNRRRSKTFNEMMEERNKTGRKSSLVVYKDEDANDLSDLGIGTHSGKSSISEEYSHDDNHLDNYSEDSRESTGQCVFDNQNGEVPRNGLNGHHDDDASTTATISSPEPEEYTYERAIQGYVNFAENRAKTRAGKTNVLNNINGNLEYPEATANEMSKNNNCSILPNGSCKKIPPPVVPRRQSAAKLEERLTALEQRRRSGKHTDVGTLESGNKVTLPKVDVLKRRELFEKVSDTDNQSPRLDRVSEDFSNAKSIRERLSHLGKQNEENANIKGKQMTNSQVSSTVKERLSHFDMSTENLSEKGSAKSLHRLSNGDISSQTLRDRLSNLEKNATFEREMSQTSRISQEVPHTIKERLSSLDSACNKEIVHKVTPDRDVGFHSKLASFQSSDKSNPGSPECSLPPSDNLYQGKQQFHRSLDSLDVERSCRAAENLSSFERVQSLEDVDRYENERNYPASASSTEMLAFSTQSGDTDREDSGIHTADVSCSVSQADEPIDDGEVVVSAPHLEPILDSYHESSETCVGIDEPVKITQPHSDASVSSDNTPDFSVGDAVAGRVDLDEVVSVSLPACHSGVGVENAGVGDAIPENLANAAVGDGCSILPFSDEYNTITACDLREEKGDSKTNSVLVEAVNLHPSYSQSPDLCSMSLVKEEVESSTPVAGGTPQHVYSTHWEAVLNDSIDTSEDNFEMCKTYPADSQDSTEFESCRSNISSPELSESMATSVVCCGPERAFPVAAPRGVAAERRRTVVEVCEKVEVTAGQLRSPPPTPFISVATSFKDTPHSDGGVLVGMAEPVTDGLKVQRTQPAGSIAITDLGDAEAFRSLEVAAESSECSGLDGETLMAGEVVSDDSGLQISPYPSLSEKQHMSEDEMFFPLVDSQIPPLVLSSDIEVVVDLEFPLGPPTSAEPPKEKPPPPPVDLSDEDVPPPVTSLKRLDSTKRIKKEIRRKRSDFLGIEGSNDDSYLEPELKVAPPPDMTLFLVEERRSEQQLYRQSICSESDSALGETTESRDSGVELDRGHLDDVSWSGRQAFTPSSEHSRQNSELYGNASTTSEEEEIMRREREIIENVEKEEQWQYKNNHPSSEQSGIGEKLAEKLRQLEQEKMRLEWERAEDEGRLRAKEAELRQQQKGASNTGQTPAPTVEAGSADQLRAERERLQLETEALVRQKEQLLLQMPQQHWDPTRRSLQDISSVPVGPPALNTLCTSSIAQTPLNYRLSLPNLQEDVASSPASGPPRRPPPPIPPAKPLRPDRNTTIRSSRVPSADNLPQQMSRQTLQALSAAPRPRLISNDTWMQPKRKPDAPRSNYQHWLVQEAEHRRITEQQQRNALSPRRPLAPAPPQPAPRADKPLPDSIIHTLTQRVQNRVVLEKAPPVSQRRSPVKEQTPPPVPPPPTNLAEMPSDSQEKMLSVSGKKKCSHCGEELGRGAAMIIESLRLFYHIDCFKCCVCHVQLGDGLMGTDVRVRNNKLHCHNCYSSDDGVKFSCV